MGIKGYVLARRLGMDSAFPAPSWFLPDPVVMRFADDIYLPRPLDILAQKARWPEERGHIDIMRWLYTLARGKRSVSPWMAPELMFPGMHSIPTTRMAA